jgi:5'-methylthioadenosine phosphorylase
MHKQWGAHLVGMTQVPEAQLARELNLPFIAIAMVTDYDAWRQSTKPACVQEIIKVLRLRFLF